MKGLAVLATSIAIAATVTAASPAGEARKPNPPEVRAALASAVVAKLNAVRASNNLAPLTMNAQLTAAAVAHSKEMLTRGYFDHNSADGTSPFGRIKKYYRKGAVSETLFWAMPTADAAAVVNTWLNSPAHKHIVLDPRWRQVGIGALFSRKAPGYFKNHPTTVVTATYGTR